MADAYQAVLSLAVDQQPSIHQFIARLSESELQHRTHLKTQAYLNPNPPLGIKKGQRKANS